MPCACVASPWGTDDGRGRAPFPYPDLGFRGRRGAHRPDPVVLLRRTGGVAAPTVAEDGPQEIAVTVRGGYSPDRIEVEAGWLVPPTFTCQEATDRTETIVFADFGVSARLPQNRPVPVEFTPEKAGEFPFHCGMNLVRDRLVVRAAKGD